MMIPRHTVGSDKLISFYQEELVRMRAYVEIARRTGRALSTLCGIAEWVYRTGSVVAADALETAEALKIAAQTNAAILVFTRIEDPPRYCPLGEGPPVTYLEPIDESHAHVGRWVDGFELATISRQSDLLSLLAEIPTELLRKSSTSGTEATYLWLDLMRAVGTCRQLSQHPAFLAYQNYCANCQDRSAHCKAIRHLSLPFLKVLSQLEREDNEGFANALTEALQMHKRYWSSTEALRTDSHGYVSVSLTALAATAWDRGLRFDVESDYIPTSWVRGNIFRCAQAKGAT